ncbi:lactoylglutathione lyase [Paramagnetospirillum caucaseum]|uniref:Lactoylglutathione lyase n=1 Tax=Paramagnetospirillum caucaseum TaxID=1244869 RepID=M2ZTQ8_9PROT|nr:VOC family protein [Paramagnetospirillum caucaseum]EME70762.1 lactoylglutathione lyase [Paramagnetospirillum caucaseum]
MALLGHDHVNIVVTDMERSIRFYAALFGLGVVMDRPLQGEWFERVTGLTGARARCVILAAPDGACRIELLEFADAPPAQAAVASTPGLRHLALRVDDLDACLAALAGQFGQRVEPIEVPQDIVRGGKRMCYIRDPDGAMVEVCQYGLEQPEFR